MQKEFSPLMDPQVISTRDMYEASLYLTLGANIKNIKIIKENRKEICQFIISGNNLQKAQINYFNGEVTVNLWDFRRCYMRLHSLIGTVRKNAKEKASKQQEAEQ